MLWNFVPGQKKSFGGRRLSGSCYILPSSYWLLTFHSSLKTILSPPPKTYTKEQIESLLNAYDCPTATLLLKGEPFVLYQRFMQRENSPSRHRGHVVNGPLPGIGAKQAFAAASFPGNLYKRDPQKG